MKPFDLEKAISGHPLCTRDGRKVLELHYFKNASEDDHYHIAALIQERDSPDVHLLETFTKDGRNLNECEQSENDLFLAPLKKTYWVTVYNDTFVKTISFEVEE